MSAPESTPSPSRWGRGLRAVAIAWTVIIFVLLWMPPPPPPENILWWWDKAVHAGLMAVFGGLWTWAGRPGRWIVPWGIAVGAITEVGQGLLPWERNSTLGDFGADVAGLVVGWLVGRMLWPRVAGARPRWW